MADALSFTIDEWTDDGNNIVACHAKADNHYVAMAAFEEAKKQYERCPLTLRQGALVMAQHLMPERKELQPRSRAG